MLEELLLEINELLKKKNETIKTLKWQVEYLAKENEGLKEKLRGKENE